MTGRRSLWITVLAALATLAVAVAPGGAYVRPGETKQIDLARDGSQPQVSILRGFAAAKNFYPSAIDAKGRFVAFSSFAIDLVENDRNLIQDVFVRDTRKGRTTRVSVATNGTEAVGPPNGTGLGFRGSTRPHITPDGRFVAFESDAVNLVPGDGNVARDVFVHDRRKGTTELISVATGGQQGNGDSDLPSISANGRYVVFDSLASNLIEDDTNESSDAFVHDRRTGKTSRVSLSIDGTQIEHAPFTSPSISANGRRIAFTGWDQDNETLRLFSDVFVYEMKTRKTKIVSVRTGGGSSTFGVSGTNPHTAANALSADGRFVTFSSNSNELVPNDSSALPSDVFVHDLKTGRTERVSVAHTGEEAESNWETPPNSYVPSISADGRFVAFHSDGINLAPGYGNEFADTSSICSVPPSLSQCHPYRVFVHDRHTGMTEMVSRAPNGQDTKPPFPECGTDEEYFKPFSWAPFLSPNGRYMSFSGCGLNPAEKKTRTTATTKPDDEHVYLRDLGKPNPFTLVTGRDRDDAGSTSRSTGRGTIAGADLVTARLAYRPQVKDVYVRLDVSHMEPPAPSLVYGLRFDAAGERYEIRATATPATPKGRFGLFRCTGSLGCREVVELRGGYGTIGDAIVMSLPLEHIGLRSGDRLQDVAAFSALGTYDVGAVRVLDEVRLGNR